MTSVTLGFAAILCGIEAIDMRIEGTAQTRCFIIVEFGQCIDGFDGIQRFQRGFLVGWHQILLRCVS